MNKIVIVTGANSGLGKAFAVALLEAGFRVVGTVRKEEAVKDFEKLRPGAAFARVLDVTDPPEGLAALWRSRAERRPGLRAHQQRGVWARRNAGRELDRRSTPAV